MVIWSGSHGPPSSVCPHPAPLPSGHGSPAPLPHSYPSRPEARSRNRFPVPAPKPFEKDAPFPMHHQTNKADTHNSAWTGRLCIYFDHAFGSRFFLIVLLINLVSFCLSCFRQLYSKLGTSHPCLRFSALGAHMDIRYS